MDEVRIRTRFMKSIIEKLASRAIRKNLGRQIGVKINDLEAEFVNDLVTLKLNGELTLTKEEFEAMLFGKGEA